MQLDQTRELARTNTQFPMPPAGAGPSRGVSIAKKLIGALVGVLLHYTEKLVLLGDQIISVYIFFFSHARRLHSVAWSVPLRKARLGELPLIIYPPAPMRKAKTVSFLSRESLRCDLLCEPGCLHSKHWELTRSLIHINQIDSLH